MNLCDLGTIKSLLKRHGLTAKKFFGQNFLTSEKAVQTSIDSAQINANDHIIEVGPGLGVLSRNIAAHCKKLTCIELDKQLFPVLEETLAEFDNVEVIHQDALQFKPPSTPYKVVANIPYNITSPLINHFLQAENPPISITFLIQKEVAEKICQLNPKMSVLSLQVALFGDAKMIQKVPSGCFHPAPKVDSAIIHINLAPKLPREKALAVLDLAKRAFKSGRKKLSNTIPDLKDKLEKLELADKRPQHLSIEDWSKLV